MTQYTVFSAAHQNLGKENYIIYIYNVKLLYSLFLAWLYTCSLKNCITVYCIQSAWKSWLKYYLKIFRKKIYKNLHISEKSRNFVPEIKKEWFHPQGRLKRVEKYQKHTPTASMKRGGGKTRKRRRQSHGLPTAKHRPLQLPYRGEKDGARRSLHSLMLGAEKLS